MKTFEVPLPIHLTTDEFLLLSFYYLQLNIFDIDNNYIVHLIYSMCFICTYSMFVGIGEV